MKTVEEIADAVRRLSPIEKADFRRWYADFDAMEINRQIEGRREELRDASFGMSHEEAWRRIANRNG